MGAIFFVWALSSMIMAVAVMLNIASRDETFLDKYPAVSIVAAPVLIVVLIFLLVIQFFDELIKIFIEFMNRNE